jgi:hypothetical protein
VYGSEFTRMKDFFISYTRRDQAWAEWVAWELEAAGYNVTIQAWDFLPGENFVVEMQRAASETGRTIAILSENYLQSNFTLPEWTAAFVQDPTSKNSRLVPVRVQECDLKGLLPAIIYIDLVGLFEEEARRKLLDGIQGVERGRRKPEKRERFPGYSGNTHAAAPDAAEPAEKPYPGDQPVEQEEEKKRKKNIRDSALRSAVISLLLMLLSWITSQTVLGEQLQIKAYNTLQFFRALPPRDDRLPVVVVDISNIRPPTPGGVTLRKPLMTLIRNLANAGAAGIGVAIDFSPLEETDDYPGGQEDVTFLNSCLEVDQRVPIYVGAFRSIGRVTDLNHLLGAKKYAPLAAAMILPQEANSLRSPLALGRAGRQKTEGGTLSAKLAGHVTVSDVRPPSFIRWAVELHHPVALPRQIRIEEFLVDYTRLRDMELEKKTASAKGELILSPTDIKDRIVVLGDADPAQSGQGFAVPGRAADVPAVFLHASAVYTLTKTPLYELKHWVRLLIDVLISAALIGAMVFIRLRYVERQERQKFHKEQQRHLNLAVLTVLATSLLMAVMLRILWLDFVLIILGLWAHPHLEARWKQRSSSAADAA